MENIDWENGVFKVVYSDKFDSFGDKGAVSIFHARSGRRGMWDLVLSDMSVSVLKYSDFPEKIVKAAEKVVKNKKARIAN